MPLISRLEPTEADWINLRPPGALWRDFRSPPSISTFIGNQGCLAAPSHLSIFSLFHFQSKSGTPPFPLKAVQCMYSGSPTGLRTARARCDRAARGSVRFAQGKSAHPAVWTAGRGVRYPSRVLSCSPDRQLACRTPVRRRHKGPGGRRRRCSAWSITATRRPSLNSRAAQHRLRAALPREITTNQHETQQKVSHKHHGPGRARNSPHAQRTAATAAARSCARANQE